MLQWTILVPIATFAFAQQPLIESDKNLPSSAFSVSQEPHDLQLLNSGLAALEKRLQIIESARQSIEIEYFLYRNDRVGRLLTQALVKKAREGVQVRFLVDDTPLSENIDDYLFTTLKKNGVAVRYYNHAWFWQFNKLNHRSHKKSLIVDDEVAIVGGRNIGDEYFDMHQDYNYLDRDIFVQGPIVKSIRESFDAYWKVSTTGKHRHRPTVQDFGFDSEKEFRRDGLRSDISRRQYYNFRNLLRRYDAGMERALNFIRPNDSDFELRLLLAEKAQSELEKAKIEVCRETYFFADLPGHKKQSRIVYNKLKEFFGSAKKSITAESLYLIFSSVSKEFKEALERGVNLEVLTNSANSSKNPLATAAFFYGFKEFTQNEADFFLFNGKHPAHIETLFDEAKTAFWGLHTKSVVIDDETSILMSYNIDPRSKNINAEMALVCRGNSNLALALKEDIKLRQVNAQQLSADGKTVDGDSPYQDISLSKKIIFKLAKPIARLIEFLL